VSVVEPRPKRTWGRRPWEWLPTPYGGRIMVPSKQESQRSGDPRMRAFTPITLMIVPGPERLLQIVRIELDTPVARGFATKEQARAWIERAIRAGVLPTGVVEVEPPGATDQ
jgi:hypothetical protein